LGGVPEQQAELHHGGRCQIFCVSSGYLVERRHCCDDDHERERAGRAA
jgi:hypothetical protein